MDWLRRNWPDLLIGVALIAVIAGIVATLLSGGSFFPLGQQTSTPRPAPTASAPPPSPNTGGISTPSETSTSPTTTTTPVNPTTTTPESTATSSTPATTEPIIPVLPTIGNNASPAPSTLDPAAGSTTPPVTAEPATVIIPGATGNLTAEQNALLNQASYRLSVGAFGSRENAERLAASYRAEGYPVFTAQQGNLTLVLLGPYSDQGEADRIAQQLKSAGREVNVYFFDPEGTGATATTAAVTSAVAPAAALSPAPATEDERRYLQVGAYATLESSLPQRERLESLGYEVSQRQTETLYKLLIGPFSSSELATVQDRLNAQGIENFPTR